MDVQHYLLTIFGIFAYLNVETFSVDCRGRKDGVYEKGCRSFTKCVNGKSIIYQCDIQTAYHPETEKCEYAFNVPPPCGTYRECSTLSDGSYPDLDNKCMSFYTCTDGRFKGHTLCPPGLVFNVGIQVCDWPFNVTVPCGTLV